MNARLNKLVNRAKNPRDKNFRRHLYIFLICCGISMFIWFLIKMTDDYVTDIRMPVRYTNVPDDKQLNNTGDRITVKLRGNGGDLFSVKYISGGGKIEVDLANLDLKKSRFFDKHYFLTSKLLPQLSERFDFDHTLLSISPDTLFIDLDDIISRSLPVKADISVSPSEQYMVYDSIVTIPAEIMVSGPAPVIDTLESVSTKHIDLEEINKTTEIIVPIVFPIKDKNIRYSENEVKLIIPLEKYTESSVELPVKWKSSDTGIRDIRMFPETVQIVYQVAVKDYMLVKPELFSVYAEYDPEKDSEKTFLKVRVEESPDFVRITRIQPDKVEFIIRK